jgi:hypothetical protein
LEEEYGESHINTAATIGNIANVFRDERNYEKALEWYKRW